MKTVSFYTLGCKLNQAETAMLAEQFERGGFQLTPFGEPVDICVINTCTVTARSDYRCQQMIRKARKKSPAAQIAVVGCYAQLSPDKIQALEGVDYILGSDKKFDLLKICQGEDRNHGLLFKPSTNESYMSPGPGNFWDHTRAFLKIQDGCDNFCAYCIVPLARGKSRSDSIDHILKMAGELVARGHLEIILTGVHIGRYGRDLKPVTNLLELLRELESIPDLKRIRLSSVEPLEISPDLIEWVARSEKICHHFHIPLQSGDDAILSRMDRNYSSKAYNDIIQRLKNLIPDCGIGTDIMVGFPGENEQNFQTTLRVVEQLPFTYLHVFSFSPRPGTKAFGLPGRVPPQEIKRRSEKLRKIGKKKKNNFYQELIGQKLKVLWEEKAKGNLMFGFSDNYARVGSGIKRELMNKICLVEIVAAGQDFVVGEIIENNFIDI